MTIDELLQADIGDDLVIESMKVIEENTIDIASVLSTMRSVFRADEETWCGSFI